MQNYYNIILPNYLKNNFLVFSFQSLLSTYCPPHVRLVVNSPVLQGFVSAMEYNWLHFSLPISKIFGWTIKRPKHCFWSCYSSVLFILFFITCMCSQVCWPAICLVGRCRLTVWLPSPFSRYVHHLLGFYLHTVKILSLLSTIFIQIQKIFFILL